METNEITEMKSEIKSMIDKMTYESFIEDIVELDKVIYEWYMFSDEENEDLEFGEWLDEYDLKDFYIEVKNVFIDFEIKRKNVSIYTNKQGKNMTENHYNQLKNLFVSFFIETKETTWFFL